MMTAVEVLRTKGMKQMLVVLKMPLEVISQARLLPREGVSDCKAP
jgi:hypothetical protein